MRSIFLKSFIKSELTGWKPPEIIGLCLVLGTVFYNYIFLHDSIIAVISAICGIMYTVIAGKGKISCYIFGLTGSGFYSYLALSNALYGNLALYIIYYIPMQILGIFKWKSHLKEKTNEIYKTKLDTKERIILSIVSVTLCLMGYLILIKLNDSHPVSDSIATMLSIVGMYLTVRRAIEQWIIWMIVNAISAFMWIKVTLSGSNTCSTVIMWSVYFVLAVYFYREWKKELNYIPN